MTTDEWIKTLKVGDEVAVEGYYYGNISYTRAAVLKITPTGRVTVGFRVTTGYGSEARTQTFRPNGREFRDVGYGVSYSLKPWTPAVAIVADAAAARQKLVNASWKKLSDDHALAAVAALRAAGIPGFAESGEVG